MGLREALTVIGTVVGAYFGNPQLGYAIGAFVGGLVDPEVHPGPRAGDIAQQTSSEGVPCPLFAGTAGAAGNLIFKGPVDPVISEEGGKGGEPVVSVERLYCTFAIRIGASLFTAPGNRSSPLGLVKVWEDEKLVYDVSPESTILAESADYAAGFTFYRGDESQLPDPAMEAIKGIGNVPAYRGRAYIVFSRKDLTDRRGSVPMFRFEVSLGGDEYQNLTLVTDVRHYGGTKSNLEVAATTIGWAPAIDVVRVSPNGLYAAGADRGAITSGRFEVRKFDQEAQTWSLLSLPAFMPTNGPSAIAWSPELADDGDSKYLAVSTTDPEEQRVIVYRRDGDTFTKLADPVDLMPNNGNTALTFDSVGQRLAVGNAHSANGFVVYDFVAEVLLNRRMFSGAGTSGVGGAPNRLDFLPGLGSRYIACGNPTNLYVVRCEEDPLEIAANLADTPCAEGAYWDSSGGYLLGVDNAVVSVYSFQGSTIGGETLEFLSDSPDVMPFGAQDVSISSDRHFLAIATGQEFPSIYTWPDSLPPLPVALPDPAATGDSVTSVSWTASPDVAQVDAGTTTVDKLYLAAGGRCKMGADRFDVSNLTAKIVRGSIVASQGYTAADYMNALRWVYQLDGSDHSGLIHFPSRGGASVKTLTMADLVDDQDDNEQDETLRNGDDKRTSPIRRPLKLNLMFPNRRVGYQLTKATSPNYGDRGDAVSEITMEVPVVLDDETEAPQLADILEKISRADAEGEIVRVVHEGAGAALTAGDVVTLVEYGLTRRLRVENMRGGSCVNRLRMRVDRPYANTSQISRQPVPAPPPPPPSLPGITQFVVLNIPGIIDADDTVPGIRVGVRGVAGSAWSGAVVQVSSDEGVTYTTLATITRAARIGALQAAITAASAYYTDTTNVLSVQMVGDEELESITQAHFLSEGNGAALCYGDGTAELIQFRDAVDDGDREWTLSRLQRGRLNTDPGAHLAGAQFVMLDGTTFLPLPTSLMGMSLRLRFVSLGTSPEAAPTFDFEWAPPLSQTEFPPANLILDRVDANTITALIVPRHRFGTEDNPIPSANFIGYRWAATDGGSNSVAFDSPALNASATITVAGWASPITVTVAALNRYTGAGPSISEEIP